MAVQAVILAAGKGTRMRSARAKVLQPLMGLPLLEYVLRSVRGAGADEILVVVGHQAEAVAAAFAGRARFVTQEPALGTGHALQVALRDLARGPGRTLLVLNGDLPLLRQETLGALLAAHERAGSAATLLTARLADAGAYGRVLKGADGGVERIVEARDASPEERAVRDFNVGVYVFELEALLPALRALDNANAQAEYYLTDVIGLLRRAGRAVAAFECADPDEALGVNTLAELADVERRLRRARVQELLEAGVAIEDPDSTWVGPDARVEADARLRPFTLLEGRSVVRGGASVGPFCRLVDCEVGAGAQVLDHCLLRECTVGAGASVGPFAHLRPETTVGARARVGNFVELKKTALGAGSKAPHLSYLGDATIGDGVNVGAGTITCNYDGVSKHPTRIEDGAFIGSDSTLVAPVTVGAGAYVAAGSAITEDVPAGALALGRSRQVTKPGWVERRRASQRGK